MTVKVLGGDIDLKYLAGLSVGYAGLYQLGYLSYVPGESYWVVWPANGFLFAFLAVLPLRSWPIYIGITWATAVFVSGVLQGLPASFSLPVAVYDTVEPICGILLLWRFVGRPFRLDHPKHVLWFLLLAAFGPTVVSSFVGSLTLHYSMGEPFLLIWQIWWLADSLGYVLVGILTYSWLTAPAQLRRFDLAGSGLEYLSLLTLTVVASSLLFFGGALVGLEAWPSEIHMILFPLIFWAGLRFRIHHTSLVTGVIAVIAIIGLIQGTGASHAHPGSIYSEVINLQIFIAGLAIAGVLLSTYVENSVKLQRSDEEHTKALRKSEERYHLAVRGSTDGIWDWNILTGEGYLSDRWKELLGFKPGELPNEFSSFEAKLHPDDRERVMRATQHHLEKRVPYEIEMRLRTKSGDYKWFLSRGQALWDDEGKPVRMSGSISDITERKQAEESLQRTNRALKVLGEGNYALVHATDERQLLQDICRIIVETGGYIFAWVGSAERDERKSVTPLAHWGVEKGYLETVNITWADEERGRGPVGAAIRTGKPGIAKNIRTDPNFAPWREEALKRGYESLIGLPLGAEDNMIGALAIYAPEVDAFDEEEMELLVNLSENLTFGIQALRGRAERERAEEALRESEKRIAGILELAPEAIISIDEKGSIHLFNRGAEDIFGYDSPDMLDKSIDILLPQRFRADHHKHIEQFISSPETSVLMSRRGEIMGLRRDGSEFRAEASISKLESGGETILTVMLHDVSERKQAEEHLHRIQKMEALDNLTGGVAHEFNNLLMAILGNLELIDDEITGNESVAKKLSRAMESALRGKKLTQQLLAYSRTGSLHPQLTDLNEAVLRSCRMFDQALEETIEIKTKTSGRLWTVMIDPGELEGVLLNLVVNARDAMPGGGTITIETANRKLTKKDVATVPDLKPGNYVTIAVTDTGRGISLDVIEHVFDPFFTTKEVGEGTGLGLSMILGFTRQAGGTAEIESEPGYGTTVRLYLPQAKDAAKGGARPGKKTLEETQAPPTGTETILCVEDDPDVLMIGVTMLESLGYTVLEAKDGPSGLALLKGKQHMDLLLTDVVMPGGMQGTELAQKALALRPHLKVILATGYDPEEVEQSIGDGMPLPIIKKPFRKHELAFKLREILDGAA